MGYTKDNFTEDPNVIDPNHPDYDPTKVLATANPDRSGTMSFKFNPTQEEEIRKAAELALESQISIKAGFTKGHADQQDSGTTIGKKDRDRQASGLYGEAVNLVTGDAAAAESAGTALAAIVNDNLEEGEQRITDIDRSTDGKTFTVTREDGVSFEVSTTANDGVTAKTTKEIVKEIFQEVNPYGNIDVVMATEAYTGTVPDAVGEGGASSNVRAQTIQALDYQLPITVDGNEVGAEAYLTSKLDERFDAGDNAEAGDIKVAFTTVVNELIRGNSQLTNLGFDIGATDADGETGVIQMIFPGLPDTGDGEGVRIISNTNDKSIAEAYSELQKFLDEWVEVTNTSAGGMTNF